MKCITLSNARNALSKLDHKDIQTDLIFLDLNMPIMSGEQFLAEIKKNHSLRDIPVIILFTTSHKGTTEAAKKWALRTSLPSPIILMI